VCHQPQLITTIINNNNNNNNNKGSRKESKIQEFIYRDTTEVEHKMFDYTGNNGSHRNNNKRFEEKFGSDTRKAFSRFITKDSYTWNITHNMEILQSET
jgi:hypothetical protein